MTRPRYKSKICLDVETTSLTEEFFVICSTEFESSSNLIPKGTNLYVKNFPKSLANYPEFFKTRLGHEIILESFYHGSIV